jgi:hypothetical protein
VERQSSIRVHWTGDDGFVHEVTRKGSVLHWRVRSRPSCVPCPGGRGLITGFSRSSRFRLLCLFNNIDWPACHESALFVTLTYRDRPSTFTSKGMNRDRSLFFRSIERRHGEIGAIWRTEWKTRRSGQHVGELYPHVHMLLPGWRYLPAKEVQEAWTSALGEADPVKVDVQRMKSARQAGFYLSKYLAKEESSLPLSFRHTCTRPVPRARAWGIVRRSEIPWCPEVKVRMRGTDEVMDVRRLMLEKRGKVPESTESVTVIGDGVDDLWRLLQSAVDTEKDDW